MNERNLDIMYQIMRRGGGSTYHINKITGVPRRTLEKVMFDLESVQLVRSYYVSSKNNKYLTRMWTLTEFGEAVALVKGARHVFISGYVDGSSPSYDLTIGIENRIGATNGGIPF